MRDVRVPIHSERVRCSACKACCSTDFTRTGTMSAQRAGFQQRQRIGGIGLVALHIGAHVGRRQQHDFDAQAIEPARPVVGGAAGFHDDQRDFAVREPALELRARQAMRFDDMPLAIGHGQLENVLGKIDGDGSSIHFGFLELSGADPHVQ